MNVKITRYGTIEVILSRRNVVDLLQAMDAPNCEHDRTLVRQTEGGILRVTVEADEKHYGTRLAGPGISYPGVKDYPGSRIPLADWTPK